jgi:hypothetical protein
MRVVCSKSGPILIGPRVLPQKDICVLEALEEDLKATWLRGERLLLPIETAAIPEWVVEGLG